MLDTPWSALETDMKQQRLYIETYTAVEMTDKDDELPVTDGVQTGEE